MRGDWLPKGWVGPGFPRKMEGREHWGPATTVTKQWSSPSLRLELHWRLNAPLAFVAVLAVSWRCAIRGANWACSLPPPVLSTRVSRDPERLDADSSACGEKYGVYAKRLRFEGEREVWSTVAWWVFPSACPIVMLSDGSSRSMTSGTGVQETPQCQGAWEVWLATARQRTLPPLMLNHDACERHQTAV
ncbi:hypothetical protein MPH_08941 [Macrophomina phaseolina MS6]|uniref:Uncharacterized protein n=1 Tax=Macrophomina phaseolina (strain MS6) TaxID=1126212 RepID=K2RMA0_MACPH|nr:hypothetical protein MPH_08941 [Macrophomina phaseolina MS6]